MLTIPSGVRLDANVIKAVKSLLIGSVVGLSSENISITDSNGNVYSSLVRSIDDQLSKLQEKIPPFFRPAAALIKTIEAQNQPSFLFFP